MSRLPLYGTPEEEEKLAEWVRAEVAKREQEEQDELDKEVDTRSHFVVNSDVSSDGGAHPLKTQLRAWVPGPTTTVVFHATGDALPGLTTVVGANLSHWSEATAELCRREMEYRDQYRRLKKQKGKTTQPDFGVKKQ